MKTSIKVHYRRYYVTSPLSNALSGFNLEQMLRANSINAKKELSFLFAARSGKKFYILSAVNDN